MRLLNYVIIGNSAAAVGGIEGIRSVDQDGKITVISDEPYHTYSRPLISYWLEGKVKDSNIYYRDKDFYEKNKCETIFGRTVVSIDKNAKQVILDDNTSVSYDRLLVSTGSKPFIPSISGLESVSQKYSFMTFDSAKEVKAALKKPQRVLIMGAGLIGLKAAEAIADKVSSLTIVDLADRILPSILTNDAARIVQKHIEAHGAKFILSQSVKEFHGNTAVLSGGDTVDFDILITAVGVRPNTELISDAGGKVARGIVTNKAQMTSIKNVYAAGDCTVSHDVSSGSDKILALLPNAYKQGEVAGINMAGGKAVYENAIPMNAIGFFGLHMITAGSYEGKTYIKKSGSQYKCIYYSDDVLKGYILIGDVGNAGIYTNMIRERIPLKTVDKKLMFESPRLMAMPFAYRREKLGGIKQ